MSDKDVCLQGIPQMEPLVMEAMSWAAKPTVDSVHPQEPNVLSCREQIKSTLATSLQPAYDYIARVQAYESWLTIDTAAYVDALQASCLEYRAGIEQSVVHSSVLHELDPVEHCAKPLCSCISTHNWRLQIML